MNEATVVSGHRPSPYPVGSSGIGGAAADVAEGIVGSL